jgi:superfamily II DNA helicase RecQ
VIQRLRHPRVIALTATAALPVRRDIVQRLGLREHREVIGSFDRPNLHLGVQRFTDDTDKRHSVITGVRTLTADPAIRCGLVSAASRKDTEFYAGELAQCLQEHNQPVRPAQLKDEVDVSAAQRTTAVNLLEQAGAVVTTSDGQLQYVDPDLRADHAVERVVDAAKSHQRLIRSRIEMMRGYAETIGCRRQYLLGYFGEQLTHPCGNCDTCAATATPVPRTSYPVTASSPGAARRNTAGGGTAS